jgi:hypothetical protein
MEIASGKEIDGVCLVRTMEGRSRKFPLLLRQSILQVANCKSMKESMHLSLSISFVAFIELSLE